MVGALVLMGCAGASSQPSASPNPDAQDAASDEPPPDERDTVPSGSEPSADDPGFSPDDLGFVTSAEAVHVPDGDSFEVTIDGAEERVRMIGINTPEGDECLGDRAGTRLRDAILGQEITLATLDPIGSGQARDEFGRILAFVFLEGDLLNHRLVAEGLAVARAQTAHPAASALEEAEAVARQEGLGIWASDACGPAVESNVRIADLNADAPGPDEENPNGEWVELRNEGPEPADLTDWMIRDESTRHRYQFPSGFVLEPDTTVKLRTGCGTDSPTELFWCERGTSVWNNGGDTALLLDPNGNIVDTLAYETVQHRSAP